ncbi:coproporphyrinogen III oxidase [Raphidocelis subcapitata]|uniref:Coproporphyrinogen III oxidase n=1 Tax=Raphidocelis subcapitata TaxID=307507 RepID=A0A2V0P725_9CHLO|nr:coproporphyrinogen III oxidase [Raphidocelis subcapitata]|eukprot:GBF93673.1 coproporphyrinogen III oxidase [Raphidocelis subcapitata]
MPGAAQQQEAATAAGTDFARFERYVLDLQDRILSEAEAIDGSGKRFLRDRWSRGSESAGYGITAVLEGGDLLEKAAANISIIHGELSAQRAQAMSSRGRADIDPKGGQPYSAAAMSLVFHSAHPLVPTLRADVRLFQVAGSAWFGGGCDLTPSYLFEEDARDFHAHWRRVCERYGEGVYPEFKAWCDRYFYIPCRKEHRGIGGLFFDDVASGEAGYDAEAFVREVGDNILPSWTAIAARRRALPYSGAQRQWQLLRRGRYLEFNLLYDRGVKFGLDGGRVESIMVSAPPLIAWKYGVEAAEGSEEARLVEVLRAPREWA